MYEAVYSIPGSRSVWPRSQSRFPPDRSAAFSPIRREPLGRGEGMNE